MSKDGFELFQLPKRLNDSGAGAALYYVCHKSPAGEYVGIMDDTRQRAFSNLSSARAHARICTDQGARVDAIVMVDQTGFCMFNAESSIKEERTYKDFGSW